MVAKVVEIGFRLIFFWTGWQALQSLPLFLGSGALMQVWPGSHKATKIRKMSRNVIHFAPDPIPDRSRSDPLNASLHVHYIQHPADLWPQPTCFVVFPLQIGEGCIFVASTVWSDLIGMALWHKSGILPWSYHEFRWILEVVVCGTFFNELGSLDGSQQAYVSVGQPDLISQSGVQCAALIQTSSVHDPNSRRYAAKLAKPAKPAKPVKQASKCPTAGLLQLWFHLRDAWSGSSLSPADFVVHQVMRSWGLAIVDSGCSQLLDGMMIELTIWHSLGNSWFPIVDSFCFMFYVVTCCYHLVEPCWTLWVKPHIMIAYDCLIAEICRGSH